MPQQSHADFSKTDIPTAFVPGPEVDEEAEEKAESLGHVWV